MTDKKVIGALFDFDGVIVDTEPQYAAYWGKIGKKYRPDIKDISLKVKGKTLTYIIRDFFGMEMEQELTERLHDFGLTMKFPLIPGAIEFIASMKKSGAKMAIVTSSNNDIMQNVYKQIPELRQYFDEVLTADDFTLSKPDPQCFLRAAQSLGLAKEDCVVFEDSENGLKAAKNAQMKIVGLTTTNTVELVSSIADITVPNFTQLDISRVYKLIEK